MIDTLVVATDGSESGERAVVVALDLARRFDATVHALSVVDTTDDSDPSEAKDHEAKDHETDDGSDGGDHSGDEDAARRERAEKTVAAVAERVDREIHTVVRDGAPADVVRAYAAECGADLVATGTRGRHGAHRFLLGSVAEEVVRTCPVPVLTVRQLAPDA